MSSYQHYMASIVVACAAILLSACSGGSGTRNEDGGGGTADDMAMSQPSVLSIDWSEKVTVGPYDFSRISFTEGSPGIYIDFGGTDQGGWFVESRGNDRAVDPEQPFFFVRFGWSPDYSHEWFGKHPANFVDMTIRTHTDFCYAIDTSDQFIRMNGKDQYGTYTELSTGPIRIQRSSSACAGTPSFTPAGTVTMTLRYRCRGSEHYRRSFPKWACPE